MTEISTFLMFEGTAGEAMELYVSLFPDAEIERVDRFGPGEEGAEGTIRLAVFRLAGRRFRCIDSPIAHGFGFTPAVSIHVACDTPEEVDRLWEALVDGGEVLMPLAEYTFSPRYGWLNDRFGVSWQLMS